MTHNSTGFNMESKKIKKILGTINPFDKIRLELKDSREFEVMFIDFKNDVIRIKFDSGYNAGFKKENLKSITKISSRKEKRSEQKANIVYEKKKGLKNILIIHTGGTIASKVDYETGGVKALIKAEELISLFPELREIVNIDTKLLMNVFSEDFEVRDYNMILKEIKSQYQKYDGFIITHGTDTLHYTASALKFAIDGLSKPIILVGSQRSSDRPSTDSRLNLLSAAYFISKTDYSDVAICMHKSTNDTEAVILNGFNTRKMHSSRRDAFRQIGSSPVAFVDFGKRKIDMLQDCPAVKICSDPEITYYNEKLKLGILYAHPSMTVEEIKAFSSFDGLLIIGTGLGHISINDNDFSKNGGRIFSELKKLSETTVIVMTTQTIYGRVNLNVYSTGRKLKSIGILGNLCSTTPETSFIKLFYLLSKYTKKEVKELYGKNLKGEIVEREFLSL